MMNNLFTPLKIGVFYDGNFFLHASNYYNYFHKQHSRLSIGGLHSYITKRVAEEFELSPNQCQIVESHYYRGRINAVEASQRGNQLYNDRVFEDILMAEGVETHYLPLRNLMGRKEERGIDVLLSLDAFEHSVTRKIDVAVLIVADTNYVPLIRKINSIGVRTVLLSWEFDYVNDEGIKVVTKTSHELMQLASYTVLMHEEIEDGLIHNQDSIVSLFVDGAEMPEDDEQEELLNNTVHQSEILSLRNGFGFVKFPNNNLYFHQQDVIGDFFEFVVGDPIEFTLGKNHKGEDVARNVRKIYQSGNDE